MQPSDELLAVTSKAGKAKRLSKKIASEEPECESSETRTSPKENEIVLATAASWVRRPPPRWHAQRNDIYVTRRHPLIVSYKRACHVLGDLACNTVRVHGLGACVKGAVWLTQDILKHFGRLVEIQETHLTTTVVTDERHTEAFELEQRARRVFGIVITLRLVQQKG